MYHQVSIYSTESTYINSWYVSSQWLSQWLVFSLGGLACAIYNYIQEYFYSAVNWSIPIGGIWNREPTIINRSVHRGGVVSWVTCDLPVGYIYIYKTAAYICILILFLRVDEIYIVHRTAVVVKPFCCITQNITQVIPRNEAAWIQKHAKQQYSRCSM